MSSLPPPPVPLAYASAKGSAFCSTRGVSRAVRLLLWASVLVGLASALFYYWQLELLWAAQAKVFASHAQAVANDTRIAVVNGLQILLMLATAIVFLIWVYRATANLRCFSSRELELSPGAAVAWFFCPVVNLIRIPQAVRQIYNRSSDPELSDKKMPAVIGWWWACWIMAGLALRAAGMMVHPHATLGELIAATWTAIVGEFIYFAAAMCAIGFVARIDRMQQEHPAHFEDATPPPFPTASLGEGTQNQ